ALRLRRPAHRRSPLWCLLPHVAWDAAAVVVGQSGDGRRLWTRVELVWQSRRGNLRAALLQGPQGLRLTRRPNGLPGRSLAARSRLGEVSVYLPSVGQVAV